MDSKKIFICLLFCPLLCLAKPQDPVVISGKANFKSHSSNELHINTSDRAIINWKSFSIDKQELTKFVQENASSAVLNRVVGGDPSILLGLLESNGSVFLINPNGVLVGKGSLINTNEFVASTLDLKNEEFLANGDLLFSGDSKASIVNFGTINAWDGDVVLLGYVVENHGELNASHGVVGLGAGSEILLQVGGPQRIYIKPSPEYKEEQVSEGIRNAGHIKAMQAELIANGNSYSHAIKHDGSIEATSLVKKNGRILLKAEGGEVFVSGKMRAKNSDSSGGEVQILGDRVGLWNGTQIDVSGEKEGGKVLVGGDFQGKNAEIPNAKDTIISNDVEIDVSALQKGKGGTAIVWADETTQFHGLIKGLGGIEGGDGGFVEISGREGLNYAGNVDLTASSGNMGTLLIDPKTIHIAEHGHEPPVGQKFDRDPHHLVHISGRALSKALNSASVTLQANNDIVFKDVVPEPHKNSSLTLQAGRSIEFNKGSELKLHGGNLIAVVNDTHAELGHRDPGVGVFSMGLEGQGHDPFIQTNNGNVHISSGAFSRRGGAFHISGKDTNIDSGNGRINISMKGFITADGINRAVVIENGASLKGNNISIEGITGDLVLGQIKAKQLELKSTNAIQQKEGLLAAEKIFLNAPKGINSLETSSSSINAVNSQSGGISITNRTKLSTTATLTNGSGRSNNQQGIALTQLGGGSLTVSNSSADGPMAILAVEGKESLTLNNISCGDKFIAVANRNLNIPQGSTVRAQKEITLVADQQHPIHAGRGFFNNFGDVISKENKIAIYAAAGPRTPKNTHMEHNRVNLKGNLRKIGDWDIHRREGLASKYGTSYSRGGFVHGHGFEHHYTPGHGVFGEGIIWYKSPPFPDYSIIERAAVASAYEQKYYLYMCYPYQIIPTTTFVFSEADVSLETTDCCDNLCECEPRSKTSWHVK